MKSCRLRVRLIKPRGKSKAQSAGPRMRSETPPTKRNSAQALAPEPTVAVDAEEER